MHFFIQLTNQEIASYVFGIIGMIGFVASFQCKKRWLLLVLQSVALLAFGIQYYLLGSVIGLITEIICVVRNLCFCFRDKNKFFKSIWLPISFIAIELVPGVLTFTGWICILPIAGFIIQTIALCFEKEIANRAVFLIASPIWLSYNLLNKAWFGAITDVLNITSIIIAIIRLTKLSKKEKEVITPVTE